MAKRISTQVAVLSSAIFFFSFFTSPKQINSRLSFLSGRGLFFERVLVAKGEWVREMVRGDSEIYRDPLESTCQQWAAVDW